MWILKLVRNFALLAVLALAAHAAAGADNRGRGNPHGGGSCNTSADCPRSCSECFAGGQANRCWPKQLNSTLKKRNWWRFILWPRQRGRTTLLTMSDTTVRC